jgi:phosphatidylethanolamine/phosphatidyl-N-methylethanolamine N-methyltransferase
MPSNSLLRMSSDSADAAARRREHNWHFLRQWVRHPLRTASMLPSSKALARLMVAGIGPDTGHVVELGAGTGALTEEILNVGVAPQNLTVVELNPHFADFLQREYPGIRVLSAGAEDLPLYVEPRTVGAVISSLPMVVIAPRDQRRIVESAFEALQPGHPFYQFTYSHRCPIARRVVTQLGLSAECVGSTLRNWPPARVFRITRKGSAMRVSPRARD